MKCYQSWVEGFSVLKTLLDVIHAIVHSASDYMNLDALMAQELLHGKVWISLLPSSLTI